MMIDFFQISEHWVHDLSPFLIKFPDNWPLLGGNGIRWYGLSYLMGFWVGLLMLFNYFKKGISPYPSEKVSDLSIFIIIGVLAGGRLGFVLLYGWGDFISDPLMFFRVWEGGMASHGGFMGVAIAVVLFAKLNKQSLLETGDLIVSVSSPGILFGRIANFINGELWGKPTTVDWAIIFPKADFQPRHPSQLYEGFSEGLILFIYMQLRIWSKLGKRPPHGQLIGEYLLLYSIFRIICEIFREPDEGLSSLMMLSRGQFYSLGTLIAGGLFILFSRKIAAKKEHTC